LHNHFIPHEGNEFQPHFLRLKIVGGIFAVLVLIEGFYLAHNFFVIPSNDSLAAIFASVLVDQTNKERLDAQLNRLIPNPQLEEAARLKAEDMAKNGYFSHVSPDGKDPWYWFQKVNYDYAAAGENLAVNFIDSRDVTEAWMHSPSHRENILSENYTQIGIATAEGMYKGKPAIFIVQEFGRPSFVARDVGVPSATTSIENIVAAGKPSVKPPVISGSGVSQAVISSTTKSSVAGNETTKLAVVSAETPLTPSPATTPPEEKPAQVITSNPTALENVIASPRQSTAFVYIVFGLVIALALGFAIFINIRVQHAHIIINGVLLLVVLIAFIVLNAVLNSLQGTI